MPANRSQYGHVVGTPYSRFGARERLAGYFPTALEMTHRADEEVTAFRFEEQRLTS